MGRVFCASGAPGDRFGKVMSGKCESVDEYDKY